jgi:hypothetical protein
MSAETTTIPYQGLTPGADANTYVMFSTVAAFPAPNYVAMNRMKRLQVGLSNSQAGIYNWYKSNTRLTSTQTTPVWTQIGTVAVVAGATVENTNDFLIEEYADFKLEWVNGGVAQATWVVSLALSGERVKST